MVPTCKADAKLWQLLPFGQKRADHFCFIFKQITAFLEYINEA